MSHPSVGTVRTLRAAAAVWLIIGVLVLAGVVAGVAANIVSNVARSTPAAPTAYQVARQQHVADYWAAYQADTAVTPKDQASAVAEGDKLCQWKTRDPQSYAAYLSPSHTAARGALGQLAVTDGARLAETYLCGS